MSDFTIALTNDEIEALEEMLGLDTLSNENLQNYIKKLAEIVIKKRVDEDWNKKTLEDKKTLLGSAFSIKK